MALAAPRGRQWVAGSQAGQIWVSSSQVNVGRGSGGIGRRAWGRLCGLGRESSSASASCVARVSKGMAVVTAAQQQQTLPSRASRVPRCCPPTSPGSRGLSLPLAGRSLGLEEWGDLPRIWLPLLGAGHRQGCHPCRKAPHILCCSLGRRVSPGPLPPPLPQIQPPLSPSSMLSSSAVSPGCPPGPGGLVLAHVP